MSYILCCPVFFKDTTISQDLTDFLPKAASDFQINTAGSSGRYWIGSPLRTINSNASSYSADGCPCDLPCLSCDRTVTRFRPKIKITVYTNHFSRSNDSFFRSVHARIFSRERRKLIIPQEQNRRPLAHFTNIAGRGGLFVGGSCPVFLFAEIEYPRVHSFSFRHTSNE